MARGQQMRSVELVEVDADEPGDVASSGSATDHPSGPSSPGGPRRPRTGRRLAAVVVVALAAGAAGVVQGRLESDRVRALADVPGVVAPPLDGPVAVRWRLADAWDGQLRSAAGHLLAVVHPPRRGIAVVGLDPATGTEVWRTPVSERGGRSGAYAWCEVAGPRDPAEDPVLVCLVVDDTDTVDAAGIGSATYPTSARLVVLDARTGAVLHDDPVPPTTTALPLEGDVLIAHVADDGHVDLTRRDPRDRTERWSYRTPHRVPRDELGQRPMSVQADGGLVVVDAGATWVFTADGDLVRSWPEDEDEDEDEDDQPAGGHDFVQLLGDRGLLVHASGAVEGRWRGEVVDVATGRTFRVDGHPAPLWPDDGSLHDVLLVEHSDGSGRTGYDVESGRPLWTAPAAIGAASMVLDAHVVSLDAHGLRSVDGRTGEVAWSREVAAISGSTSLVTDGRVLLVSSAGDSGRGVVTAYGVDDGRERWSTELGTDVHLFALDGVLLGHVPDGVVVMGPAPDGG